MGSTPGPLPEIGSDVCYLLQATNDVPEADITAGDWVVVYDEGMPIGPEQIVAYLAFSGGPVHVGVNGQLDGCIVQGRVAGVLRPMEQENDSTGPIGQEG